MTTANLQNLFLREKTLENYADNSILELILTTAGIQDDLPDIVKRLLDSFGTLRGILEARPEQLMQIHGMTKRAVTALSLITPLTRVWERCNMQNPGILDSIIDAEAYCKSLLMGERNEKFYTIALNSKCALLGTRLISDGTINEVQAYPRKVIETALNYNANYIIVCHNHPGSTCAPSQEDVDSTQRLQTLLNSLNIILLDHFIVAGSNVYSMKLHGDLDREKKKALEARTNKQKKKTKSSKKKQE